MADGESAGGIGSLSPVIRKLGAPMQLLIVDDDLINAEIVSQNLREVDGLEVRYQTNPLTALEECGARLPDLVIVDYRMPEMDGIRFIEALRGLPDAEDVPILMITASASTDVLFHAMEVGANDFVGKPVDPVELIARVKNMMKLRLRTLELMEANRQLRNLAITDSLTGLFNRRHFMELGAIEIERARRFKKPLSVIMLDADHFKSVNDTYGHAVGDAVLRFLAGVFEDTTRRVDVIGRLGGEEFAICVLETGIEDSFQLAERIRRRVETSDIESGDSRLRITVSAGVAELSRDDGTISDLINRADKALYQSKRNGRNRVMA